MHGQCEGRDKFQNEDDQAELHHGVVFKLIERFPNQASHKLQNSDIEFFHELLSRWVTRNVVQREAQVLNNHQSLIIVPDTAQCNKARAIDLCVAQLLMTGGC